MRYEIVYNNEDYDTPEAYLIRDTKHEIIVARVKVSDYRERVKATGDFIRDRREILNAELTALDTASLIMEKLEVAAENGEVV